MPACNLWFIASFHLLLAGITGITGSVLKLLCISIMSALLHSGMFKVT
jgi:hypothetical protein